MKKTIVTGQQIGIGGGTLYTIYKVIGLASLSQKWNSRAIYWMETNDADFEEINSLTGVDSQGKLFSLRWFKKTGGKRIGSIEVDQNLLDLFEEYFDNIEKTPHTEQLKKKVMSCYRLNESLQICSERLAKWFFDFLPIEYFSPDDLLFRKFSRPFLINEINKAKKSHEKTQINAFMLKNDIRLAIFAESKKVVTRLGEVVDIDEETILLPNVNNRNVLQDAFFNCCTYVAGPNEVAYIKKLKEQYLFHGVKPAKVKNRMSLTILSKEQDQSIKSLGFNLEDFETKKPSELEREFLIRKTGIDLKQMEKELKKKKDFFLQSLPPGDSIAKLERLLFKQLKHLKGEHRKRLKSIHQKELSKIKKLSHWIRPYDQPQERVFNGLLMMNKWGNDWVKSIAKIHQFKKKILVLPNEKPNFFNFHDNVDCIPPSAKRH